MFKEKNAGMDVTAEEINKLLGACAGCGWRRGEPCAVVKGPAWKKVIVVKIPCKAVQNAKVHVAPMTNLETHDECPRRKRAEEKRERDSERRVTSEVVVLSEYHTKIPPKRRSMSLLPGMA